MFRVLACGSRSWTRRSPVTKALQGLKARHGRFHLIHGNAEGLDRLAGQEGLKLGLIVTAVPALWDDEGRAAGPTRNRLMLAYGRPDLVIAFHEDPDLGRGTAHMVRIAREAGVPVGIYEADAAWLPAGRPRVLGVG